MIFLPEAATILLVILFLIAPLNSLGAWLVVIAIVVLVIWSVSTIFNIRQEELQARHLKMPYVPRRGPHEGYEYRKIPPWVRPGREVIVQQGYGYLVGNIYWIVAVISSGIVYLDVDGIHTPVDVDDISQLSGR